MFLKYLFGKWLTFLQMKLHCVDINDNIKWDARFDCRPASEHWTEFVHGHFAHYVFDCLFVGILRFLVFVHLLLHLRHKLLRGNTLLKDDPKRPFAFYSAYKSWSDRQIKHFDVYAILSNANSVFSYHSAVANVEQIHSEWSDWSLRRSNYAMTTKIFRCELL
jgi:hypothetical protein